MNLDGIPFIHVNPMIKESELKNIEVLVQKYAFTERAVEKEKKQQNELTEAMQITSEISSIIENFEIYHVDPNIKYNEILDRIGFSLGDCNESANAISKAIADRESLATQVIPQYELALFTLHA